jgi:hypothetical protein
MKPNTCIIAIIGFFIFLEAIIAQVVNVRLSSAVYTWERFDTVDVSKVLVRGLQSLQFDLTQGDISLQTYLGGATNFNDPFGNDGFVRVYNAVLRWKNIGDVADLSVGRVPVFAGVGNGTVDGGLVRARLMKNDLTLVAYGGANVRTNLHKTNIENLKENLFVGGQVIGNLTRDLRLGLSYMKRNVGRESYIALRPDSLFNPVPVLFEPDSRAEQLFGVDARYTYRPITVYTRYDYDIYTKRSLRAQFSGRITATKTLDLTLDYIYREPRIFYNSPFIVFSLLPVDEYEGGIEYALSPSLRANGKAALVKYSGDDALRYTLSLYGEYFSFAYSGTGGYAGDLNSIYAQGMYPLFDRMLIPTVGVSYAMYRLSEGGKKENVYAASLGGVLRPQPAYSIDLHIQWLQNPVARSDVRVFGKVSYWFHHNLDLL